MNLVPEVCNVGRLKYCVSNWLKITQDQWVIDAISGYCIDFDSQPFQTRIPHEIPFNKEQRLIVENEVLALLDKGAIIPSFHEKDEFISTIFIVPKSNGKFRPVINLKYLNEFVHYDHFKQETFKVVLDLLQENDFMTSIDLQDAYFSVPIHKDFQKYLKFSWGNQLFMFVSLPFGLKSAPYVFTKILKPVFAWFRHQNIRCSYYIDDSLNMNGDRAVCQNNTSTMVQTLEQLGFVVNQLKSVLIPTQRIVFFGFIIDTVEFKVFLTEDKIQKLITKSKLLLGKEVVIVRELASFIGSVVNAFYAVLEAPLHYRNMERNKLAGLGSDMNFDNNVVLTEESRQELFWWSKFVVEKNGKRIRPREINTRCRTDASLQGWGALDLNTHKHANGRWALHELGFSINYLELLAIFYGLQSFYSQLKDIHIQIQSDNISAVTYINDMGGISSEGMDLLAKSIWEWCLTRDIYISAVYIPGIDNTADFYSRNFSDSTEWKLKESIFNRICQHFFLPDVDLFASRLNKQVDCFVSWFPEPGSIHSDAFTLNWGKFHPYLFPPFNLIGKVINKILQDQVNEAILIFPYWKSQSWFPMLLECLISIPVRLPRHKDLLFLPHSGRLHPMGKGMRIFGAVVSGKHCRVEGFRHRLLQSSQLRGNQGLEINTSMPGDTGLFGTCSGLAIPIKQLR